MRFSQRLDLIPPYLFARLDQMKEAALGRGVDVIDLGVGDPVDPTPVMVVEKLCAEVLKGEHHRYPPYQGTRRFREAVAAYYRRRFQVDLDPSTQILGLIGSKEGLAHLPTAVLDPGSIALVPDPAYPVYAMSTILAGGEPHAMPLEERNHWLADLDTIEPAVIEKSRLMFLNYPNNPTAAVADLGYLGKVVEFARRHNLILAYDNAYADIYLDGSPPPSILQLEGAMEVAVEFNSLSKPYNMTGWRLGYVVGNPAVIQALGKVKKNIDSGTFTALQAAGAIALEQGDAAIETARGIYRRRRDLLVKTLKSLGWPIQEPRATFYLWAPVAENMSSMDFAGMLLEKTGILVSPGNGFGRRGEGYFRISLTASDEVVQECARRLVSAEIGYMRP